jgi:hypothetical protein
MKRGKHSLQQSSEDETRNQLAELVHDTILGKVELVDGCRQVASLHRRLGDADDDAIIVVIGVASETDEFPVGASRRRWSPESLAEMDAERDAYLAKVRESLMSALAVIEKRNRGG